LIPATVALIDAELGGRPSLAEALGVALADDWTPEHHDTETLEFWRARLAEPGSSGWWMHYGVRTDAESPTLVASVGYKGPPAEGRVEIGYSVVPSHQRRGLATEACRALIESAWERGASLVVAHTYPELAPSIGVLRKLGFTPAESSEPGAIAFELRRDA
jgi:RimJ/RimL family protein N-acetyltransferase